MFKNLDKTGLITGVALGLTATTLLPVFKKSLLTVGVIGVKGAMSFVNGTKSTLLLAREEIEDIIAEAQFERLKDQLSKEIDTMPEEKG